MAEEKSPKQKRKPLDGWSVESATLVAGAAALPVVYASGFTAYGVLKDTVLMVLGAVLLGSFAVRAIRGERAGLRAAIAVLPLFALAAVALTSSLWANNAWLALGASAKWVALTGVVVTLVNPAVPKPRLDLLAMGFAAGAGVSALIGIIAAFGVDVHGLSPGLPTDGFRGTFDNEREAALSLAVVAPFLALGVGAFDGIPRIVCGVGVALAALFIGITHVTDAWIVLGAGSLVGVGVLAWRGLGEGKARLIAGGGSVAAVAGIVAIGYFVQPTHPTVDATPGLSDLERSVATGEREWGRPSHVRSADEHSFAVTSGWRTFNDAPIFGVGAGNLGGVIPGFADWSSPWYKSQSSSFPFPTTAHNAYVDLAAELGAIGLALFVLFVVLGVWLAVQALLGKPTPVVGRDLATLLAGLAAALTAMAFDSTLVWASTAFFLVAMLGLMLRRVADAADSAARGMLRSWRLKGEGGALASFERLGLATIVPLVLGLGVLAAGPQAAASDFYKARGDVWIRAGDQSKAFNAYDEALAINPGNDKALFMVGHLSQLQKAYSEAEVHLARAIELRPNDPRLHHTLSDLQLTLALEAGRQKLIGTFRKDEPKKPDDKVPDDKVPDDKKPEPRVNPADVMANIDKGILNNAIYNGKRALELHPRYLDAHLGMANLYFTAKRVEDGTKALTDALDYFSNNRTIAAQLHEKLGKGYLLGEKLAEAQKHLEKALELEPEHPRKASIIRDLERIEAEKGGGAVPGHKH